MSRRRGVSLIELMVVIAIITTLFGMVGVVFHRLFLSEQMAMRAALIERNTARLAVQFRSDVHAASSAQREQSGNRLDQQLKLIGSSARVPTVVYSAGEDQVSRELIVDGQTTSHEQFRLPECIVQFPAPTAEAGVELMTLIIERQSSLITPQPQAVRPRRTLAIEACLGRDARIAKSLAEASSSPAKEESQ
jgi:prepilin-type N-terminal cleavage/methylation domain-containing protein